MRRRKDSDFGSLILGFIGLALIGAIIQLIWMLRWWIVGICGFVFFIKISNIIPLAKEISKEFALRRAKNTPRAAPLPQPSFSPRPAPATAAAPRQAAPLEQSNSPPPRRAAGVSAAPKQTFSYNPSKNTGFGKGIKFAAIDNAESVNKGSVNTEDVSNEFSGLVDAFTGATLNEGLGIFQCSRCKVFYHRSSFDLLKEKSSGQCVSCLSSGTIAPVVVVGHKYSGRNPDVNVVTLADYLKHVGRVIIFEGFVYNVRESSRGGDFAVMFEDKNWINGFKMVVFRKNVLQAGGEHFIYSLIGRTIKVRGLLVCNSRFGNEIVVSERGMILSIK